MSILHPRFSILASALAVASVLSLLWPSAALQAAEFSAPVGTRPNLILRGPNPTNSALQDLQAPSLQLSNSPSLQAPNTPPLQPATNSPRQSPDASAATAGPVTSSSTNPLIQQSTNASAPSASPASMDTLDDKHRLAIGDKLSFRIVEDEEDPKSLIVTDSGELELPYLGRFPANKKTCKQLAFEIKAALEKEYYYQATVIIAVDLMTKSRGKIYLAGAVRLPGPQDLPSDEILTLSKAILRSGGFTDFADRTKVHITRKTASGDYEKRFTVNVSLILDKGQTDQDPPLEADDLVVIPERTIRF